MKFNLLSFLCDLIILSIKELKFRQDFIFAITYYKSMHSWTKSNNKFERNIAFFRKYRFNKSFSNIEKA